MPPGLKRRQSHAGVGRLDAAPGEEVGFAADSPVEEAVTPGFPASWENTGNFLRRASILHHRYKKGALCQALAGQFPRSANRVLFGHLQGTLCRHQRNFWSDQVSSPIVRGCAPRIARLSYRAAACRLPLRKHAAGLAKSTRAETQITVGLIPGVQISAGFSHVHRLYTGRGADAFSHLQSLPEFSPQIVVTDFYSEAGTSSTCPG